MGEISVQKHGISMRTPRGPTFANYMCEIGNKAFNSILNKPRIYCRYIDDCFLMIDNISQLHTLKNYFEEHSVVKFTIQYEVNKKLHFLDVLISRQHQHLQTSIFRKTTNMGDCHNISSTWKYFDQEVTAVKQLLIDKGYSFLLADTQVAKFINRVINNNRNNKTSITQT